MSARLGRAATSASGFRVSNSAKRADEIRRAFQVALPRGAVAVIAKEMRVSERWVRDRIEGHALAGLDAVELEAIAFIAPEEQERIERLRLRGTCLAVARRSGPSRLLPNPAASLGQAAARIMAAAETAALAASDGRVTADEAAVTRAHAEPGLIEAVDALASLEAAAGERLLP